MAATTTFIGAGGYWPHTPDSEVSAGDMVVMGEVVGHAPRDIAADEEGTIQTEGIVEVPKASTSGSAITQGQRLYWDASNLIAVTTKSTHKCLGFAQEAAASGDSTVRVALARWYDS